MKKELFSNERRDFFSKIFIAGTGSLALLSLSGCNGSDNSPDNNGTSTVQLTAEQKYTLLYMYQEEKLARDVYTYFDDIAIYNAETNTFANIKLSEQNHMDAVEKLCIKYDVDISDVDESLYGEFVIQELKTLYDQLIADGSVGLAEALQVGIDIETLDITDILDAEVGMPDDIVSVFENLREGSLNHLGAFTYALSQLP